MKYRRRTYYTDTQKAVMWERWRQGWTLHQIAHLFNRAHTSVQGILARTGEEPSSQKLLVRRNRAGHPHQKINNLERCRWSG